MFASFLDPTMSYSAAKFDESRPYAEQDLETAQLRKIDAILDMARVGAGTRVLEIGSGWGALAIRAAQRGARVTTITLSTEQLELARERIAAAGLTDSIDIRLQDYRDVRGEFDAIVSVEMIEAVGEEYWPTYFSAIDALLAPGGTVAIQAILMDHSRMLATRRSFGWIQKYIFPGGLIPSLQAIDETIADNTGLVRTEETTSGSTTPRPCVGAPSLHRVVGVGGRGAQRVRRDLPSHVGVLPRLLRGGFASGYLQVSQLQFTRR